MSQQLDKQLIKKQARHWVCCLNRGLTDNEKPHLIAWINQHPAHHRAIYKAASFFDNISELDGLNGVFPLEKKSPFLSNYQLRLIASISILTFVIIKLFMINTTLFNWQNTDVKINSYQTQIGEIRQIQLPDGSQVTLNTHSKLVSHFSDNYRSINLLYGEAKFSVVKDPSRPFTVNAGAKSFTALGTVFNVQKNNESDMELLVSEGQVLVSDSSYSQQQLTEVIHEEIAKFDSANIITDGEKSIIENKVRQPTLLLSAQAIEKELAWQQGMLIFNGESLTQALNEVSRYSKVQFEITNHDISKIKIAGYFKAGDIEGLLAALSSNFDIKYQFNATNSIQLSRSNKSHADNG